MIENKHAQDHVTYFKTQLAGLARLLADHSIPFFSPRYAAHMNSDIALPATLGYLMAMLYNQNNVAPEGGPMTTILEREVGEDLCKMLGYNRSGWGHMYVLLYSCLGSVILTI
jgi:glutamate/tyrosine decarboxylase-like PLP-dependent enzyme